MKTKEYPRFSHANTLESSLVITTIKERKLDLFELLRFLPNQTAKPYEVIVVSDESVVFPIEIVAKYNKLGINLNSVVVSCELTLGATRNIGLNEAKCNYVCFLDDDTLPAPSWLAEVWKSLNSGAELVGGVSKPLFSPGYRQPFWWDESLIGPYVAVGNQYVKLTHNAIWGCNFALVKDIISKIGPFDENFGLRKQGPKLLAEDWEFVMRAVKSKLRVEFNHRAIVYHKVNSGRINFTSLRNRALQAGLTLKRIDKKNRSRLNAVFLKDLIFKIFRGPYLVLTQKSNVAALPIYMIMIVYEIMGWLEISYE